MTAPTRILILGGTTEAKTLAGRLADDSRLEVTYSLAGRTRNPALPKVTLRSGGFGGAEGLTDYLKAERIDLMIDATHPYAAVMPFNAERACQACGLPRLRLLRPAWRQEDGDQWIEVDDARAAAAALDGMAERVFLTTGHQDMAAFADLPKITFLVRLVDPPHGALPLARYDLIQARGPFAKEEEMRLCHEHGIQALVSKNSGGDATYGKIVAARSLGLPVVMIRRPAAPAGAACATADEAETWVQSHRAAP